MYLLELFLRFNWLCGLGMNQVGRWWNSGIQSGKDDDDMNMLLVDPIMRRLIVPHGNIEMSVNDEQENNLQNW